MTDLFACCRSVPRDIRPGGRLAHQPAARLRSAGGRRRSQAEEAVAVPGCAGYRLGDLRKAGIGLAVPGEALFQDRHLQLALPLADQQRSRSEIGPLARLGDAGFKRTAFGGVESSAFRLANDAQRRFVGTAECGDLDPIRQDSYTKVPVARLRLQLSCAWVGAAGGQLRSSQRGKWAGGVPPK